MTGAGDPPTPGGFSGPTLPPIGTTIPPGRSGDPTNKPPTTLGDPPVLTPTPLPPGYPKDPPVVGDPPVGDPPGGDPPTPTLLSAPPQVVPEPSTWLLVATGLGFGIRQLLKKKRA